jgi:mannose-6-phosphate isomerase-like protein (cupin superfamily)
MPMAWIQDFSTNKPRTVIFTSGDDVEAKQLVIELVNSTGLVAIDLGSLALGGAMHEVGAPLSGLDLHFVRRLRWEQGKPPPHRHLGEDEIFTVIDGEFEFFDGESWVAFHQGEVNYSLPGSYHGFRNIGQSLGKRRRSRSRDPACHWVCAEPYLSQWNSGECASWSAGEISEEVRADWEVRTLGARVLAVSRTRARLEVARDAVSGLEIRQADINNSSIQELFSELLTVDHVYIAAGA